LVARSKEPCMQFKALFIHIFRYFNKLSCWLQIPLEAVCIRPIFIAVHMYWLALSRKR